MSRSNVVTIQNYTDDDILIKQQELTALKKFVIESQKALSQTVNECYLEKTKRTMLEQEYIKQKHQIKLLEEELTDLQKSAVSTRIGRYEPDDFISNITKSYAAINNISEARQAEYAQQAKAYIEEMKKK